MFRRVVNILQTCDVEEPYALCRLHKLFTDVMLSSLQPRYIYTRHTSNRLCHPYARFHGPNTRPTNFVSVTLVVSSRACSDVSSSHLDRVDLTEKNYFGPSGGSTTFAKDLRYV